MFLSGFTNIRIKNSRYPTNGYIIFYDFAYFWRVDYHKVIARNIRGYRNKLGFTQESLAAKVSMHSNYIARVERSEEKLSLEGLLKIAKVFKIDPHLLLLPESFMDNAPP